ncbi:uncharacterized protein LOC128221256 [Mya arenaria]|uniref:uncharacterized protein LOC128221256 n=1 Tax=Mya arenaria TaxID=6604 RepID=UPI0022E245D9|nr:uncharacterized protein LOC128221256 [Mya arenaria]
MYNKTVVDWLTEAKDDLVDVTKSKLFEIIASVVFLVLITQGKRVWFDCIHCFGLINAGVFLICPETALSLWVTGPIDGTHIFLGRSLGMMGMFWMLQYFLLRNSTDSTVQTSFLLSCCVAMLCKFLACGYLMTHNPKGKKVPTRIEEKEVTQMFYMMLLTTVGTLFHMFRSNDWGGYGEISSRANFHIRLQFVIMILVSVVGYAMPGWCVRMMFPSLEKVDSVLIFLTRAASSINIGTSFLLLRVPNFLRTGDKEAVLAANWLLCVVATSMDWVWFAMNWAQVSTGMIVMELVSDVVAITNITGALDYDLSVFQRVLLPKIKAVPGEICNTFKLKRV